MPDDDVRRILVGLGPVRFLPDRSDDVRWTVFLREIESGALRNVNVTAQLLKVLKLNSVWLRGERQPDYYRLNTHIFQLQPYSERYVWRSGFGELKRNLFSPSRTDEHVIPYVLLKGWDKTGPIDVLLRCSAIIRFYIARSPLLSKHLFDFTAPGKNSKLFSTLQVDPIESNLAKVRFSENILRDIDKVEIAKFSAEPFAANRVWECANSARANRLNGKKVWPKMMLPHVQDSIMKVTGRFGNVSLMEGTFVKSIQVLAVTEIVQDTYISKISDVVDIVPRKGGTREGHRTRHNFKYDDNYPYEPRIDDPELAGGDWDWLYELEDTSEDEIPGASSVTIKVKSDKGEERAAQNEAHHVGEHGDSTSMSVSGEGDENVGKGHVVGGGSVERENENEEEKERELPPDRPFLFHSDPQFLLDSNDIVRVAASEAPDRFGLLINGILGSQGKESGERRYNFFGDGERSPNPNSIPIIRFNKNLGESAFLPNSEKQPRHAIIVKVSSEYGVTYYFDIEMYKGSGESIAISSMFFPNRQNIPVPILMYILEHRISPNVLLGSWPSDMTHRGNFLQIVRKHMPYKKSRKLASRKLIRHQDEIEGRFIRYGSAG